MAAKTIRCPNCHEEIFVNDDEMYGTPHVCPKCGSVAYNRTNPQNISQSKSSNSKTSNYTLRRQMRNISKPKSSNIKTGKGQIADKNRVNFSARQNEYKPNVYAVLSAVFCLFLPWIIGYPFGVVGDNRAKYLGDITGHRMAVIGKIVSIVMMALYGIGLIVSLWINDWRWGLPALFGVLVVYGVYFGIALYFHRHNS